MQVNIECAPSYALAYCRLDAGETVRAETGAMAAMSSGIRTTVDAGPGGIAKGVLRRTVGGESFFMTRFTAEVQGAWVALAPKYPGDITAVQLDGTVGLNCESGSVLALSEGISDDVRAAGLRMMAMREGATVQRLRGHGTALLCSYGGLQRLEVGHGQTIVVDTGHIVAYSETISMKVGPLANVVTAKLSGEGLVAQMTGPGDVYVQSRAEVSLKSWLLPERYQNEGPA